MTDFYQQGVNPGESVDFAMLLDELLNIVETAKSMPLSSSVLVSRDEMTNILLHARDVLPVELERARRLMLDRNELIVQAEREANALIDEARSQAAHLVQRTEVVRQANNHAERIVAEAQSAAVSLRREAEDFIDKKLAAAEIVIDRVARTLQAGREKLHPNLAAPSLDDEITPEEEGQAQNSADLFDQDFV